MTRRVVAVNDRGHVIGESHHRAKLTDHEVQLVQELREDGMSLAEIGRKFGISKGAAHDLCSGRRRGHLAVGQRTVQSARLRFSVASVDEFDVCAFT